MRRRDFIKKGMVGTAALTAAGCAAFRGRKIPITSDMVSDVDFTLTIPKPKGGTMPMGEIGTTGIRVSKFGFGSHMTQEILPFTEERKTMIREAYDLGVNFFDIYEKEWNIYQYEPMGRYLAPMINDVVISTIMVPFDGRTYEQELERTLRLLGRDYIDMVRLYVDMHLSPESEQWGYWEKVFKFKKMGYIRAVGFAIHYAEDADYVIENLPVDYIIFPYNFYHNLLSNGKFSSSYEPFEARLREKGIGVVTMKPFGTDWFVRPLIHAARELGETGEISLPQAMLRYVINSDIKPDTTLGGMFTLNHVYEDIPAYYHPKMTEEEKMLLQKMRKVLHVSADNLMPDYYKFLKELAPDTPDDKDLNCVV